MPLDERAKIPAYDGFRALLLWTASAVIVISGLFPPWVRVRPGVTIPTGYHSIFWSPLDEGAVRPDYARLLMYWTLVVVITAVAVVTCSKVGYGKNYESCSEQKRLVE